MAKRGRKKVEHVPREPNGRISRANKATYWQRQRDMLETGSLDSRLGSPLGVLYRNGQVTTRQMDAGTWFAGLRKAADGALGLPPRSPIAQDMNRLSGTSGELETEEQQRTKRRDIEAYFRAESFLGINSPRLRAVLWVCVYERRHDNHEQLLSLLDGLDALNELRAGRRAA